MSAFRVVGIGTVLCFTNLVLAGGACCLMLFEWEDPQNACQAPQTSYCETGVSFVKSGKERGTVSRLARCYHVSGIESDFMIADCSYSQPGWKRIGPTLPNGQCCFVRAFASMGGYPSRNFQITPCKDTDCP